MYAVIRQYAAAGALGDLMAQRGDEVHDLISAVPGFVAYYAARDGDQLTTVTICTDREGTDESSRRAADWVKQNLSDNSMTGPTTRQGEVFMDFTA